MSHGALGMEGHCSQHPVDIYILSPSYPQDLKPVIDGVDGIKISQGLGLQDFDLIRVIGRGSYAKVLLVRLKKNDQIYAMKVVKKELVHDDEVGVPMSLRMPCQGTFCCDVSEVNQYSES